MFTKVWGGRNAERLSNMWSIRARRGKRGLCAIAHTATTERYILYISDSEKKRYQMFYHEEMKIMEEIGMFSLI